MDTMNTTDVLDVLESCYKAYASCPVGWTIRIIANDQFLEEYIRLLKDITMVPPKTPEDSPFFYYGSMKVYPDTHGLMLPGPLPTCVITMEPE